MKLLVVPFEEAGSASQFPLPLGEEGDVKRGGIMSLSERRAGLKQDGFAAHALGSLAYQEARTGHRREGHGTLQLRIVLAAGAFISVGPGVVEYILAIGM